MIPSKDTKMRVLEVLGHGKETVVMKRKAKHGQHIREDNQEEENREDFGGLPP